MKTVVKTWRNRLPIVSDDLSHWSSVFMWRQHHYQGKPTWSGMHSSCNFPDTLLFWFHVLVFFFFFVFFFLFLLPDCLIFGGYGRWWWYGETKVKVVKDGKDFSTSYIFLPRTEVLLDTASYITGSGQCDRSSGLWLFVFDTTPHLP